MLGLKIRTRFKDLDWVKRHGRVQRYELGLRPGYGRVFRIWTGLRILVSG